MTGGGGTGPCAGMCSNPISVAPNANSGDLGDRSDLSRGGRRIGSMVCGNFVAPRTFTVNGTSFDCAMGSGGTLARGSQRRLVFRSEHGQQLVRLLRDVTVQPLSRSAR